MTTSAKYQDVAERTPHFEDAESNLSRYPAEHKPITRKQSHGCLIEPWS